jgi:hypothetical protein
MARRRQTRRNAAIGIVIVATLALIAGLLTVLALQSVEPKPAERLPEPDPTFSFGQSESTPTPNTQDQPAQVNVPARADQRMLVTGSEPGVMWRATEGSCAQGISPLIERSADGGTTWADVTPFYRDVRQVLTLESFAGNQAQAVMAVGDECSVDGFRTFTQGQFWEAYPEVLEQAVYILPGDQTTIVTPGGEAVAPCAEPRALQSTSGELALLCDGDVQRLINGAWVQSGYGNVSAFAQGVDGGVAVIRKTADCGTRAVSIASTLSPSLGSCITVPRPDDASALAVSAGQAWLWNGELVATARLRE